MKVMIETISWLLCFALGAASSAQAAVRVVATSPSLAAIAQEVGGDAVEVQALASATEDPHYVDARPNLILKVNRADLLLVNGVELESGWLPALQVAARNGKIQVGGPGYVDASQLVTLLEAPAGRVDRTMGDLHPGGNPHFLNDPRRVADVARGVAKRLAALDGEHAAAYQARAERFAAELLALASEQAARFRALPADRRQVVTYHKSMVYLLDWLGLTEVATLEPRPGVAPDPGHVAQVLATMRTKQISALVQEEYYPLNTSKTLVALAAKAVPTATLVVLRGAVRFNEGERYRAYLTRIADDLFAAVSK
jgi:zinc/manganese transport system substrate-binding protein